MDRNLFFSRKNINGFLLTFTVSNVFLIEWYKNKKIMDHNLFFSRKNIKEFLSAYIVSSGNKY